jgi:hypothetical protein
MLAEYGLQAGRASESAWRCDDTGIELVPVSALRVPMTRGLDPERLRRLLSGVATGGPLPAVPVFHQSGAFVVLDRMHRIAVARAAGFTHVPCLAVDMTEARDFYCYPEGQN